MKSPSTDRETLIIEGLHRVRDGSSIAKASRQVGVPRSTLRHRLDGRQPIQEAKAEAQRLSPPQEEILVDWILAEEGAGRAPTRSQVQAFAQLVVANNGEDKAIGKHWVDRFLQRHDEIKMKAGRPLEASRVDGTNKEALEDFYSRLDHQIKTKHIATTRLFNFDETGVAEGETAYGKVLGSSLTKEAAVTESDSTEWLTILECASAAGRRLPPCVVFTGHNLQGQWFPEIFPDWAYDCSPSGWANGKIVLKWFENIFLPLTKPEDDSLWRLLVLDGARTHITIEFMYTAWLNRVQLLYLPPHTSHATQPLDVGVFGPLKTYFHQQTRSFASFSTSAPIQKQRFLQAYEKASEMAFTVDNIKAGFAASGIYPVDVSKPLRRVIQPDSQVEIPETPEASARPATPTTTQKRNEHLWYTPKNSREINAQLGTLHRNLNSVDRGFRTIAKKAGKEIDRKNAMIATLKEKNDYLKAKLESKQPVGRKAVDFNPNNTFPSIPAIAKAKFEAQQAANAYEAKHGPHLQEEALEIA